MSRIFDRIAKVVCVVGFCLSLFHASARAASFDVVYMFKGGTDGASPVGGVIIDRLGNIYGATQEGGNGGCNGPGCGTIYKITPGGAEAVLYAFTGGSDGSNPTNVLLLSGEGDLYGTATDGGQEGCIYDEGCGTAFKLSPSGTFSLLHSFAGRTDGSNPGSGLFKAGKSAFYGVTVEGGGTGCYSGYGCGTVYRLSRGGTETVLHSFGDGTNGANPYGQLIADTAGNLYETAAGGGEQNCPGGCGTLFKLSPSGRETVLYTFTGGADGSIPGGGLTMDTAGNLYGAAEEGGQSQDCYEVYGGCGTLFKLAPDGTLTVLYVFTGGNDGASPNGPLIRDSKGSLYGTAYFGGASGRGTIFKLAPDGTFNLLHTFNGADGWFPLAGLSEGRDGYLYGTTQHGGAHDDGVVFRIMK